MPEPVRVTEGAQGGGRAPCRGLSYFMKHFRSWQGVWG